VRETHINLLHLSSICIVFLTLESSIIVIVHVSLLIFSFAQNNLELGHCAHTQIHRKYTQFILQNSLMYLNFFLLFTINPLILIRGKGRHNP
jgi:hypothetical protein